MRFAFHQAPIEVYQTILVTPEAAEEDDSDEEDRYETLRKNSYVRELLIPASDSRSLVHSSNSLSATAHKPDDLIIERKLPQSQYKDGVE